VTGYQIQDLNLFQYALSKGSKNLVKYILEEHTYISPATRQLKTLDPRLILAPLPNDHTEEYGFLKLL